jgi:hypothetical protein
MKIINSGWFEKFSCIIIVFFVITNGISNFLFGELISEGLAVGATLVFIVSKIKIGISRLRSIPAFILTIYIAYNLILIISFDELPKLLFLYIYLMFLGLLCMPIYSEKCFYDNKFLIKTLLVFGCASSCYALAQRFGFDTALPLEGPIRATGLSRSSLNLTGCMLMIFSMGIFVLRDGFKKSIFLFVIFLGILAAGGRGGIISALILVILAYFRKIKDIKYLISFFLISGLIFYFFEEWFIRGFLAFDFVNDQSNLDRMVIYRNFIDEFIFLGGGIGSTSPAASRFVNATGFESSFLNLLYELGVPFAFLFVFAFVIWWISINIKSQKIIFMFLLGISPVLLGQQLLGIPSAFCAFIISSYILISYRS